MDLGQRGGGGSSEDDVALGMERKNIRIAFSFGRFSFFAAFIIPAYQE